MILVFQCKICAQWIKVWTKIFKLPKYIIIGQKAHLFNLAGRKLNGFYVLMLYQRDPAEWILDSEEITETVRSFQMRKTKADKSALNEKLILLIPAPGVEPQTSCTLWIIVVKD